MSSSSKITKGKSGQIYEEGTVTFRGKTFTSGGAFMGVNKKTGKMGGLLYAYPRERSVGTWDGTIKIPAKFTRIYRDNFGGLRQTVYFTYQGKRFIGTWFKSQGDIVRVKEIKAR